MLYIWFEPIPTGKGKGHEGKEHRKTARKTTEKNNKPHRREEAHPGQRGKGGDRRKGGTEGGRGERHGRGTHGETKVQHDGRPNHTDGARHREERPRRTGAQRQDTSGTLPLFSKWGRGNPYQNGRSPTSSGRRNRGTRCSTHNKQPRQGGAYDPKWERRAPLPKASAQRSSWVEVQ